MQRHGRHIRDDECFVVSDEFEIVCGACSRSNELLKAELCSPATGERNLDLAAPDFLRGRVWRIVNRVTEEVEPFLSVLLGLRTERVVVDARWRTGDFPVVGGRVKVDYIEHGFQEGDTRDEGFALDAVQVEVIWMSVRGCNEDNAVRHKQLKEPETSMSKLNG